MKQWNNSKQSNVHTFTNKFLELTSSLSNNMTVPLNCVAGVAWNAKKISLESSPWPPKAPWSTPFFVYRSKILQNPKCWFCFFSNHAFRGYVSFVVKFSYWCSRLGTPLIFCYDKIPKILWSWYNQLPLVVILGTTISGACSTPNIKLGTKAQTSQRILKKPSTRPELQLNRIWLLSIQLQYLQGIGIIYYLYIYRNKNQPFMQVNIPFVPQVLRDS